MSNLANNIKQEIMTKEIFKVGDRVYHIEYGWGIIEEVINISILIKIINGHAEERYWFEAKLLSFTEYTLQGFTQERPIELPKVGELCVVRDEEGDEWELCYFISYKSDAVRYKFETSFGCYNQMKRIKILD
jgi:hypothetical protein